MFLVIGVLIGMNMATRIFLSEMRELRVKGRVSVRGQSRMTLRDIGGVAMKGGIFFLVPVAIGIGLDLAFGTTMGSLFE